MSIRYTLQYIHFEPEELHPTADETTVPYQHCLVVKFQHEFDGDDRRRTRNKRLEMRDWLFEEYGLNRGYRCIDKSERISLVWIEHLHDVIKFRLVFG